METPAPTNLHLVIRRASDGHGPTLEAGPFTYSAALERWHSLVDGRKSSDPLYAVRSMDDPKFAHLAPRVYASQEAAAKALARRVSPGQSSRRQHLNLWVALGGDDRHMGGWWTTSGRAKSRGYLATLNDGRAYLTALAATLAPLD